MAFRIIIPQKARGKLIESMWSDPLWWAEEKLDGERRIGQMLGRVVRFTGTPSRVTGEPVEKTQQLPHLAGLRIDGVQVRPFPKSLAGTVLDGELYLSPSIVIEGNRSKAVTAIANSSPERAIELQKARERGWLRWAVFDCLYWKGKSIMDRPLHERHEFAACAVRTWRNPFVFALLHKIADKRMYLDEILSAGGEGVVLKHKDHRYGDDKLWVKVKGVWTADCVIMGYKDAKEMSKKVSGDVSMTKYAKLGLIGAVCVGQYALPFEKERKGGKPELVEVATISGMDDDLRSALTEHGKKFVGKVVRIKHNGREPTGRFRHPRWDGFREDKLARECVMVEDET